MTEQYDIVLQCNVGAPPTTATTTEATASPATEAATTAAAMTDFGR